jgi:hypothetical protein
MVEIEGIKPSALGWKARAPLQGIPFFASGPDWLVRQRFTNQGRAFYFSGRVHVRHRVAPTSILIVNSFISENMMHWDRIHKKNIS